MWHAYLRPFSEGRKRQQPRLLSSSWSFPSGQRENGSISKEQLRAKQPVPNPQYLAQTISTAGVHQSCQEPPDIMVLCPENGIRSPTTASPSPRPVNQPVSYLYVHIVTKTSAAWSAETNEQAHAAEFVKPLLSERRIMSSFRNPLWKTCCQRPNPGTPVSSRTCSSSLPTMRRS
jgi:hypothetical protein